MDSPNRDESLRQIEDLTEQIKMLAERENSHYTDIMLQLKELQADREIMDRLAEDAAGKLVHLYDRAEAAVRAAGQASTSYIQRKLGIGYSKAAQLIDELEKHGVIGPADGARPREVLAIPDGPLIFGEPEEK